MSTSDTGSYANNTERQIRGEKKPESPERPKKEPNLSDAEGKNKKSQLQKTSTRNKGANGKPIFDYKAVKVLILTFKFHDLEDLEEENKRCRKGFQTSKLSC